MDYTVSSARCHSTSGGNFSAENFPKFPNTALKNSEHGERAPVKPPGITMGFCILGGYIRGFSRSLEQAVVLHD
jgi:hypothetical protein